MIFGAFFEHAPVGAAVRSGAAHRLDRRRATGTCDAGRPAAHPPLRIAPRRGRCTLEAEAAAAAAAAVRAELGGDSRRAPALSQDSVGRPCRTGATRRRRACGARREFRSERTALRAARVRAFAVRVRSVHAARSNTRLRSRRDAQVDTLAKQSHVCAHGAAHRRLRYQSLSGSRERPVARRRASSRCKRREKFSRSSSFWSVGESGDFGCVRPRLGRCG